MKYLRSIVLFLCCVLSAHYTYAQPVGGVGAMLKIDSADNILLPMIIQVLPGSPAEAKLKEKLYILKVDGVSCKNKTIEQVVAMIRGMIGTKVVITTADNKQGKHSEEHDLIRATIQAPSNAASPPADPVDAFNAACEREVKLLRKQGHGIIKTYTSDCGTYFFNFNADTGTYNVVVYNMSGTNNQSGVLANVYDSKDEAAATKLNSVKGAAYTTQKGSIYFSKTGIGGIKTEQVGDGCKAMYIAVYK